MYFRSHGNLLTKSFYEPPKKARESGNHAKPDPLRRDLFALKWGAGGRAEHSREVLRGVTHITAQGTLQMGGTAGEGVKKVTRSHGLCTLPAIEEASGPELQLGLRKLRFTAAPTKGQAVR